MRNRILRISIFAAATVVLVSCLESIGYSGGKDKPDEPAVVSGIEPVFDQPNCPEIAKSSESYFKNQDTISIVVRVKIPVNGCDILRKDTIRSNTVELKFYHFDNFYCNDRPASGVLVRYRLSILEHGLLKIKVDTGGTASRGFPELGALEVIRAEGVNLIDTTINTINIPSAFICR